MTSEEIKALRMRLAAKKPGGRFKGKSSIGGSYRSVKPFSESLHPRGAGGKFVSKPGGRSKTKTQAKPILDSVRSHNQRRLEGYTYRAKEVRRHAGFMGERRRYVDDVRRNVSVDPESLRNFVHAAKEQGANPYAHLREMIPKSHGDPLKRPKSGASKPKAIDAIRSKKKTELPPITERGVNAAYRQLATAEDIAKAARGRAIDRQTRARGRIHAGGARVGDYVYARTPLTTDRGISHHTKKLEGRVVGRNSDGVLTLERGDGQRHAVHASIARPMPPDATKRHTESRLARAKELRAARAARQAKPSLKEQAAAHRAKKGTREDRVKQIVDKLRTHTEGAINKTTGYGQVMAKDIGTRRYKKLTGTDRASMLRRRKAEATP